MRQWHRHREDPSTRTLVLKLKGSKTVYFIKHYDFTKVADFTVQGCR